MLLCLLGLVFAPAARAGQTALAPLFSIGSPGTGPGQFQYPWSVAVAPSGDLYATDEYNERVQQFSGSGVFIRTWGSHGDGDDQFNSIRALAVDEVGAVYVSDLQGSIRKFTPDGQFIMRWGGYGNLPGEFAQPDGMSVRGGVLAVADQYGCRIQLLSTEGTFLSQVAGPFAGSVPGQLDNPYGVAYDASGSLVVADTYNHRIQVFTPGGQLLRAWGSYGTGPGQLTNPYGVAVGPDGSIFVSDGSNRVQRFAADGTFLESVGGTGSAPGKFDVPAGISVSPSGQVYVADLYNHRIQVFGPASVVDVRHTSWGELKRRFR